MVNVGRISTVVLMVISAALALLLQNALQLFNIILMFGAGTGLIFLLRWFWWRINAWSEITAMLVSGVISILFNFTGLGIFIFGGMDPDTSAEVIGIFPGWATYPLIVLITTLSWLLVTYLTNPEKEAVLIRFYEKTEPGGPGWKRIIFKVKSNKKAENSWNVPSGILATILGCFTIYGALFGTGYWIYGEYLKASILTIIVIILSFFLRKLWFKIKTQVF